jgi:polyisoprenyl-phosphate glycosyltransferase
MHANSDISQPIEQVKNPSSIDSGMTILSLVVPVFNEEESIEIFLETVQRLFKDQSSTRLEIIIINDGSTDSTLDILTKAQRSTPNLRIVDLSRNFGKEAALTAGLEMANGHVIVPIDVDLQDPPELIFKMIEKWKEGFEVVLARRTDRSTDHWAKRESALWFYRIYNKIADTKMPANVGDFRLMDRRVVDAIKLMPESRRFMKGLFAWVGFRTTHIDYSRVERVAGTSKFKSWRLWNFALEGLTSFSTDPLRIWTYLGFIFSFLSFLYALFIVLRVTILGVDVPGYASLMVAITFLGGIQLMGIGVLGEYLGRTYQESKRRPIYVVRHIYESRQV